MPTIESILEKGASAVMRYGIRILVIDPYNFIHTDHKGLETDAVSDMLTKVQLFAKQHDVAVFFVAHPTKPVERGKKSIVTGVDIAKSMAWFSKADMGLTVFRGDSNVTINVWKARWGWSAQCGATDLTFNPVNGRYAEAEEVQDDYDWDF
jgi:twinkle protein